MGRGDIKTAKGKRTRGSYGNTRKRKVMPTAAHPAAKKVADKEETAATKKVAEPKAVAEKKVAAPKVAAEKKPAVKKAPAAKATTEKKPAKKAEK
jgi:ribosomal small subunit protein bTHX